MSVAIKFGPSIAKNRTAWLKGAPLYAKLPTELPKFGSTPALNAVKIAVTGIALASTTFPMLSKVVMVKAFAVFEGPVLTSRSVKFKVSAVALASKVRMRAPSVLPETPFTSTEAVPVPPEGS
jgi:hypothetical protein